MPRPRTTVFIATSVDGFIARADGGLDWLSTEPDPEDPDEDYGWTGFWESVDALVMGRSTFDVVVGFGGDWPYGDTPVYVLTSHPGDVPRPDGAVVRPVTGTPQELLQELAAAGAAHVYVDGGATIQQFLRAGVIDRLVLTTVPVLLGEGIPLFGPLDRDIELRLIDTDSFAGGLVQRTYDVVHGVGERP